MVRVALLAALIISSFPSQVSANDELWVLLGSSHFTEYEGMRPSGKVWLYRSYDSCMAGLMEVLNYRGDETHRSFDSNDSEQVNVNSDDGYMATYVCVKKRIAD